MIKIKKIDILDGLELKEATFKETQFPTHFHDTYSIGILKNGIENLKIKTNNLIATPKTVVIINENELHSNGSFNTDAWTYQTINLNHDALTFLSKEVNHKTNNHFVFKNLIEDDFLYNSISNFHQTNHSNSYKHISDISKYLLQNYLVEQDDKITNYGNWQNIILEIQGLMYNNLNEKIIESPI
jgi:hypothetical protein